jgi:hypothetical protein
MPDCSINVKISVDASGFSAGINPAKQTLISSPATAVN